MGPVTRWLADDHRTLEALLDRATATPGSIELESFGDFRRGLLKHIGMEEKILFPAARRAGQAVPHFGRLRADHARLTALLVPTPTLELVAEIRSILAAHDPLEEERGGAYEACEQAVDVADVLEKLKVAPEVPVRPYQDRIAPSLLKK